MLLKDPAGISSFPLQGKGRGRRKGDQNFKEGDMEGAGVIRKEWDKKKMKTKTKTHQKKKKKGNLYIEK